MRQSITPVRRGARPSRSGPDLAPGEAGPALLRRGAPKRRLRLAHAKRLSYQGKGDSDDEVAQSRHRDWQAGGAHLGSLPKGHKGSLGQDDLVGAIMKFIALRFGAIPAPKRCLCHVSCVDEGRSASAWAHRVLT